ncbi:NYN domain-containing protein [Flavonifractor sp. DFI.6.63]|uniref:NYN domain-containing protein n=1 Tax=Lawsonibacter hominis TaxID=2763053 RepID=A0A8J6JF02_9FIRM|nr:MULTISPECIES: NYN domain-containing protein [Oscillospiraceae]MBS1383737.1 NYN domain-containing protein [Flavonifractor sp.]MDU2196106.1 NYN domain-containing protein [Clostridiales bacterium]MBC5734004.1 NYN domain-containing protein [Lawsonibacter hominis]MCI6399437.1 NYN domain-containing protein [Lawsonibacter sp.]MCQ5028458.1 NYN domain-containing protein [Flavonifractor sp. DFI.6.63]
MPDNPNDLRLAVLIDADNASRTAMRDVMAEIAVYGTPTIKRIYGDWTTPNMASWKPILLENAITPIQQYGYTTGKNSTDSAMIIDAMDILYTGEVDGFVLVSSDSDFTRLAVRLREAGKKVYGMGERKTPSPFIVACDKFVYIEVIRSAADQARAEEQARTEPPREEKTAKTKKSSKKKPEDPSPAPEPEPSAPGPADGVPPEIITLIADSLDMLADEDGYTFMGDLGNLLVKKQPDFDPRNFGFSKLTNLVRALDRFEVDVRQTSLPHVKHIFVRDRQRK